MYRLDILCFASEFRFSLRDMRRFAGEAGSVVVVAEGDRKMIGFVIVSLEGEEAYVVTLDVDPAVRRAGVARKLMDRAMREAMSVGARLARLHVHVGNAGAVMFYERLGFCVVREERGFYGEGIHALVYERVLSRDSSISL